MNDATKIIFPLSHKINDNIFSHDSLARLQKAKEIYDNDSILIASGWRYSKNLHKPLAKYIFDFYKKNFEIDQKNIICLEKAKDTIGEAIYLRKIINAKNTVGKIIIITSDWHHKRAKYIFKFVFGNASPNKLFFIQVEGSEQEKKIEKNNLSLDKFKEMMRGCSAGDLKEIVKRVKNKHILYM